MPISSLFPSSWSLTEEHTIQGVLRHEDGFFFRHQKVKVYSNLFFGLIPMQVGTFETDVNGKFTLSYKRFKWMKSSDHNLTFKIFEETLLGSSSFLPRRMERAVHNIEFTKPGGVVHQKDVNLVGRLYEYQNDLPNLHESDDLPDAWGARYLTALLGAGGYEQLVRVIGDLANLEIPTIENLYGRDYPELANLDPKDTVEMLLNGICPANFLKGKTANDRRMEISWDGYDYDANTNIALPNVKAHFHLVNDQLTLKSIDIKFKEDQGYRTFRVADKGFKLALYVFNSMALLKGEVVHHLGIAHLSTGQNAMATFRSINKNPIGHLLKPHLRGVLEINRFGKTAIFGKDGILNISGLTEKGIKESLTDVLSGICYTQFHPRRPLLPSHRFAIAGNLYWNVLTDVVDKFFEANEKEIVERWYEIYDLSNNLVQHSIPHRAWEGKKHDQWADPSEIDDPTVGGRVRYKGEVRSVRPITMSIEGPQAGDMERLKQFIRYSVYLSTFDHWAVHRAQHTVTELGFGTLAPRKPVSLPYGNVEKEDANHQLSTAHTLLDFEATGEGRLMDNPNGDIYPYLIKALNSRKKEFMNLGYDISKMFLGTII
ncbi:hypothetical protein SCG7109_AD_00430 [Chlamydiales bacterium SCGC AG-110-M15]|nr:hypothetical protein SCG7109_AD_00430 [Chlamydiales bacterium SCGC AG-110-M15]